MPAVDKGRCRRRVAAVAAVVVAVSGILAVGAALVSRAAVGNVAVRVVDNAALKTVAGDARVLIGFLTEESLAVDVNVQEAAAARGALALGTLLVCFITCRPRVGLALELGHGGALCWMIGLVCGRTRRRGDGSQMVCHAARIIPQIVNIDGSLDTRMAYSRGVVLEVLPLFARDSSCYSRPNSR